MDQGKVLDCKVTECAYNQGKQCHAKAITVGSEHAMCDTFMNGAGKGGVQSTGLVGACHMSGCKYNSSLECSAPGIHVGAHVDHADCETYSQR